MEKYRLKKKVGPHFAAGHKLMKPGTIVEVFSSKDFGAAAHKFEYVGSDALFDDPPVPTQPEDPDKTGSGVLSTVHKGGGRWNVERSDGTKINDAFLTKPAAEKLLETYAAAPAGPTEPPKRQRRS